MGVLTSVLGAALAVLGAALAVVGAALATAIPRADTPLSQRERGRG